MVYFSMIKWLFRRFWMEAPSFRSETQWNMEREEDAWEAITVQLERIADALEHWRGMQ